MADLGHARVEQVKVAVWCIPRSTSTIFSKCLCGINDIKVFSELFSWASAIRGLYFNRTGSHLPEDVEGNETVFDEAIEGLQATLGAKVSPTRLSFKLIHDEVDATTTRFIFMKEQVMDPYSFRPYIPEGFKHTFIIRHPSRVYTSYRKAVKAMFAESLPPDYDLVRDDVLENKPMEWYDNLLVFWKYVLENLDPNPVVIDSHDLLSNPGPTLRAYCKAVGFPYSDDLLQWKATPDLPENMEAGSRDIYKGLVYFYSTALNSTHFVPTNDPGPIPRDELTDDVIRCVDHALPVYLKMCKYKVTI